MNEMSFQEKQRAIEITQRLMSSRRGSDREDEELARNLGFGSSQAMYRQFRNWGLPEWLIDEPEGSGPPGESAQPSSGKKRRQARMGGEAVPLPPANRAEQLFREALEALSSYMEKPEPASDAPAGFMDVTFTEQSTLASLEEQLQAGRFVGDMVSRPDPRDVYELRREDLPQQEWEQACETYGIDPEQDSFLVNAEIGISPQGATRHPPDFLSALIGAYILSGKDLEPLVERLHPTPETLDWDRLRNLVYDNGKEGQKFVPGMWYKARQIATLVRGGTLRKGPPTESFDEDELFAARRISWLKKRGLSYKQVHERLKRYGYSLEDIHRLGKISPPEPSWDSAEDDHPSA